MPLQKIQFKPGFNKQATETGADGTPAQKGRLDSKADKMVLEMEDKWVILDLEELHKYIKKNKLKKVYVNDLISKLEWTIFIPKKS
jgi:hypothetical protein